ncbi:MAG TPA: glycosyltransferase [Gryllotalpicola sp.]
MTVYHYYARYLEHPSGVTDAIDHWVQACLDAGRPTQILVASPRGSDANEFARLDEVRVVRHLGRSRATWVPLGLRGLLRRGDVLFVHEGWVLSNVVAVRIARRAGARVVVVPHGVYEPQMVAAQRDVLGMRARMERWMLRAADAVHVFYPGEQRVVRAVEPAVRGFITAPNGTPDVDAVRPWTGDGDYFLWLGRFDPYHKGLDNLVRFWARLPQPRPRLVLAGPDFLGGRQRVAELVTELGLTGQVELLSRVTGEEKAALIASCRAYLHPSRWESCSITLLEMAASGVPSLISETIHAADELRPQGVLRSVRFDDETDPGAALRAIDRNEDIGRAARDWAAASGNWKAVGRDFARQLDELDELDAPVALGETAGEATDERVGS